MRPASLALGLQLRPPMVWKLDRDGGGRRGRRGRRERMGGEDYELQRRREEYIVSKVSGMMGDAVQGVGCSLLSGLPCVREPPQSTVPPGPPKGGDRSQQEVPARPHKRG